ncbi:UDP-N-acetylmuramate dehydrogenase [Flammeovirgaceae bacterium SG7u.111]|nr:UDP-N-acetylmuramate dehydrogenase [Flammeovirgaceae bacterium SG7u.132]WPO33269.1 UDP-N-acetylmuramate dehydrogenase [Flammeovirgaceae bacterium SG7u.111]
MNVQNSFSLLPFNTFHAEVKAKYFFEAKSTADLLELLTPTFCKTERFLILGGGSNILFTQDVDGWVIRMATSGKELVKEDEEFAYVKAQAGEEWHSFVLYSIAQGWQGLENLSLIPGTVGASPIQNIGAYGVELKDVFEELEALNTQTGKVETFGKEDCQFAYRNSFFKRQPRGNYIILNVTFKLCKKPQFNTSYGAIAQELGKMGVETLSPKAISDAVISIRESKLPDPAEIGNCGSFFKNPEIPSAQYDAVKKAHPTAPGYKLDGGLVKVPAGWLIEQCGWKGKKVGNVGAFEKQALVIVNHGNATGQEAKDLALAIQASVLERFGVEIIPEVNII